MTHDLTNGSPMKLILGFAVPTLLGLVFQQMYNMVDTVIVGRLLGARALAAVGATGSVSFLIIGFCTGVCSGFAIPAAQSIGAGDKSAMRRYVYNAAILSALIAAVMTAATCALCRRILTAMDTPADIIDTAYSYIFVIFLGIPVTFLYNLLAGVIRSLGDSRTPVYFLALSSVLNIALDIVLILFAGLGAAGAAIATVVSQGVSGCACLVFVRLKLPVLHIERDERRFDAGLCGDLLGMGLPMGLQYSITAIGSIALQSAVNRLGSLYVAAVTAGSKLSQLLACPFDSMGAAMATYCGQNSGARKLDRLSRGVRDCSVLGFCWSVLAFGAMAFFAPRCVMWFIDSGDAELDAAALIALASRFIRINTLFYFPLALVNILRFSIQGMGFGTLAISAGVLEMAARSAVARWFVPAAGYDAACFASPAAWIAADLFLLPACILCIHHLGRFGPSGNPHTPRRFLRRRRNHI